MVATEFVQGMFDCRDPVGVAALRQLGDGLPKAGQEQTLGGPALFVEKATRTAEFRRRAGKAVNEEGGTGDGGISPPHKWGVFGCMKGTQLDCHG